MRLMCICQINQTVHMENQGTCDNKKGHTNERRPNAIFRRVRGLKCKYLKVIKIVTLCRFDFGRIFKLKIDFE